MPIYKIDQCNHVMQQTVWIKLNLINRHLVPNSDVTKEIQN